MRSALLVCIGILLASLAVSCNGGSDPGRTPAASATAAATATPIAVTGLFSDARPIAPDERRSLGPAPAVFPPWNGTSTMLYDIAAGTAIDLGPGNVGQFSPDGMWMVWVAGARDDAFRGEVRVINTSTHEQRAIGAGHFAAFLADGRPGYLDGNVATAVDLATGDRAVVDPRSFGQPDTSAMTPDGMLLRRTASPDDFAKGAAYELVNPAGAVLVSFDAYAAVPAGAGGIAVATAPDIRLVDGNGRRHGTVNVFLVDYTGTARFVETSTWADGNWPLAANADFVAWTDGYCDQPPGTTKFFDRRTGRITEIDATLFFMRFTPDGLLAAGAFGAKELIDPATLDRRVALTDAGESSWSPDYRYASTGVAPGHGGLCM